MQGGSMFQERANPIRTVTTCLALGKAFDKEDNPWASPRESLSQQPLTRHCPCPYHCQ